MSKIYQIGRAWKGFPALRYLVIFGDSYSDVGLQYARTIPSAVQPLGAKFPGLTFAEVDQPNWVGHLITKYSPPPRFDPSVKEDELDPVYLDSPLLVYDYAVGGVTVAGVRNQVEKSFLSLKPTSTIWNAEDTLFITWVGINDVGRNAEPVAAIDELFSIQEMLFNAGARNLLFIDVPPIQHSPAWSAGPSPQSTDRYQKWNTVLYHAIQKFCETHGDTSVFLFSSYQLFDAFLSRPQQFNLNPEDVHKPAGDIWIDHLHPTSKVHDIIASNLASFLEQIQPPNLEIPRDFRVLLHFNGLVVFFVWYNCLSVLAVKNVDRNLLCCESLSHGLNRLYSSRYSVQGLFKSSACGSFLAVEGPKTCTYLNSDLHTF
ncbi:SGNH hydrolase-type esterase domain-containing protein [Gymnopilus junonius]|uniref:SGNH hydrolase-type esterase domain-containing protein n=1 Tax=Gymnopilus junonius TaxID=109634 RepID=A0A9P5NWZ9_GYMJU|nr:SGNH hydrolase-type esterase domain-containing protein [Gymnopilus junonius]